jgi:predicted GH43/DUF377 family glycosyl hydrolase
LELTRYAGNPILEPIADHPWESRTVFNTGVTMHDGKIVLIYRAQGTENNVSRLGYAESTDGRNFTRLPEPIFVPESADEAFGVEDPRLTWIDGRCHMVYTAWGPDTKTGRTGVDEYGYPYAWIQVNHASTTDFHTWERHGMVFDGPDNKDVALFPSRIGGKYMAFHRLPPSMWVAYSDDLHTWGDYKEIMTPREGYYDELKLGAGGPPIETELGWLVIYHGVDHDGVYRLGVALLDKDDPTKVLNRPREPILTPEEPWELEGDVPNVVFTCGTAELGDDYFIYYGGADKVIALATANKKELLDFAAHGDE